MVIVAISMLWPFLIYVAGIVFVLIVMYGLSYVLGERHMGPETDTPYESGIMVTGSARHRYPAQFYLIAILFVIFDLEVVFLVAWSIGAKGSGVPGYFGMLIFTVMLVVGLIYEWRMGAIDQLAKNYQLLKDRKADKDERL